MRLIDALMESMYRAAFETDGDSMWNSGCWVRYHAIERVVNEQPTAQTEPLTDKEQRIFLAAMAREKDVCKQVDDKYGDWDESDKSSLVRTCYEIIRKVKSALWR